MSTLPLASLSVHREVTGVIGFRAGLNVQRLPASVYWFGLRRWDILRFDGTEDDYWRYLDAFYARLDGVASADGGESAVADVEGSVQGPSGQVQAPGAQRTPRCWRNPSGRRRRCWGRSSGRSAGRSTCDGRSGEAIKLGAG